MKKTLVLSLLSLLAAGTLSGAAFADPPFLNGHAWQSPPAAWNNHGNNHWNQRNWAHDRFQNARQATRLHWQFDKQHYFNQRQHAHNRYENRLQHLRTAEARFDKNHSWFRH